MILLQFEVTEMSLPVVVLGKCDASHVDWKHSVFFQTPLLIFVVDLLNDMSYKLQQIESLQQIRHIWTCWR